MKVSKLLVVFSTVVLLFTISFTRARAENISIRSETMVRFFERDTSSKTDALIVPAYQYLQLDVGEPGENSGVEDASGPASSPSERSRLRDPNQTRSIIRP